MEGNQVPQELVVKVGEAFENVLKEASNINLFLSDVSGKIFYYEQHCNMNFPVKSSFCGYELYLTCWFLISRLIKYERNAMRTCL